MISEKLGHRLDEPLAVLIKKTFLGSVSPAALTLAGLVLNILAAAAIIAGWWKSAACIILLAGFCDMLDGAAARVLEKTSPFGAFLDSVVDRYSDMVILLGFIVYYATRQNIPMVVVITITSIGCVLIPYARAKAECLIPLCNVGIMERPERIILLAAGCLFDLVGPLFVVLAVLTHITVAQRIYYTWKHTQKPAQ
ncbi:MAG: CDP-alcohol phosphatidyltransferase family protein [Desulfobacterota bacterium]|nr:CDP-alcohol phosphatidyltransferase family protein [Thermodesulfobacteriota bacterium]